MSIYTAPNNILNSIYNTGTFFKQNLFLSLKSSDERYLLIKSENINQNFTRKLTVNEILTNTITPIYTSLAPNQIRNVGYTERALVTTPGTINSTPTVIATININRKGIYVINSNLIISAAAVNIKVDLEIQIIGNSNSINGDNAGIIAGAQEYPNVNNSKTLDCLAYFKCDGNNQSVNLRVSCNGSFTLNYETGSLLEILRIA